jgi:hypothetical protein
MAPEIALAECRTAKPGARLLDPMSGSGTSLRIASDSGLSAIGFDLDPLAVLISRVWTRRVSEKAVKNSVAELLEEAKGVSSSTHLPWIDDDPETEAFIDYWFASAQKAALRKIAAALSARQGPAADVCRVALSRIIVTKDRGASKARDTSHSRPHVLYEDDDYDVPLNFARSVARVAKILEDTPPAGTARVRRGDARMLRDVEDSSIDLVVTSPPYLNAIDYMRGHRLSLVWLGHSLSDLRTVRSTSIGAEKKYQGDVEAETIEITTSLQLGTLAPRWLSMVYRYATDVSQMVLQVARTLKTGASAVLVVGNSCVKNCYIDNATIVSAAGKLHGLDLISRIDRDLPAAKRYLPPPSADAKSDLSNRMRSETILKFAKPMTSRKRPARRSA